MITLKTLPEASRQEVFDQVVDHLLTQNKVSQNSDGLCVYKNEEGLKCAAGCFISDEEYDGYKMEGNEWDFLAKTGLVPRMHMTLIKRMQDVHDMGLPEEWEGALKYLAQEEKLTFNRNPLK